MSVNVGVLVEISGLRNVNEQVSIATMLTDVVRAERLEHEVDVTTAGESPDLRVRADSGEHRVIFSRFYVWQPAFEDMLVARTQSLVPHADVTFDWDYEDEY